jgi:small conductance mechanosensitive channel
VLFVVLLAFVVQFIVHRVINRLTERATQSFLPQLRGSVANSRLMSGRTGNGRHSTPPGPRRRRRSASDDSVAADAAAAREAALAGGREPRAGEPAAGAPGAGPAQLSGTPELAGEPEPAEGLAGASQGQIDGVAAQAEAGIVDERRKQRVRALGAILRSASSIAIFSIAGFVILGDLGINLAPLLASAGVVGVAIGFGAQNLVRDVISGFFLILEDQVRIGDLARINGVAGTVEQINLRTIVVRDGEGAVQVFPNGTITALANLSKQFAYAVVDVRIAYSENMDRVIGTMREVGASMERDPLWGALLLAPLDVLGVESLSDGAATVRVKFKTQPLNQGRVANELRRRLMIAFVGRGIKPFA